MSKPVIIKIKGLQDLRDSQEEKMELITLGKYSKRNGSYYVSYKETEVTGMEGVVTTVKIKDDKVTVKRFGKVNASLVFEKNKRNICHYNTPYGAMMIGIDTKSLSSDVNDDGGVVDIDYSVDINNVLTGNNTFHMIIKEDMGNGQA
ncbi:MAG: DUF1934 domain-containing protein [Clostridia bacterium]|nr:DUF1934 domain-containing protein [Clostridia bacterium]